MHNKAKTKKHKNIVRNNKTVKNIDCKKLYAPFEKTFEKKIKKQNIDLTSTNYNLEEQILKQLEKEVSPSRIDPKDDFYTYINDRWMINNHKNCVDCVRMDNFHVVQSNVNKKLISIFKDYCYSHESRETANMKRLLKSSVNYSNNEQSLENCNNFLKMCNKYYQDKENYFKFIAYLNTNPIISWCAPVVFTAQIDDNNPDKLICGFVEPSVTLINHEMYDEKKVKENKSYQHFLNHYFSYIDKLFVNVFGENHVYDIKHVYYCECKMMEMYECAKFKNKEYNVVDIKDFKKYNFNYVDFFSEIGFEKYPEQIFIGDLNYFGCINKLLKENWVDERWKTYFLYIYLRNEQRFNITGYEITYNFQYKFVKGALELPTTVLNSVYILTYCYNDFLNNKYIDYANDELIIEYAKSLTTDLSEVFLRIIKRNNWLDNKTKKCALDKLKNITYNIGSKKIVDDGLYVEFEEVNPYNNLVKMGNAIVKKVIKQLGTKSIELPSTLDWSYFPPKIVGNPSFLVNACYILNQNQIDIPLGYLQYPFVSLKQRGIEYNLAHVGFTIAHELSHALDDLGSKYDKNGKRVDWWTKKDKENFYKIQKDITEQYDKFASYDDFDFDSTISIGENLADISSLAICVEYLRDFQLLNKYILPIQAISFKTFFIYYAHQQRQIMNRNVVKAQILTDPHPLEKYRTNVPLSRIEIFRKLFKISKKDKMWWKNKNKVWS